MSTDQAPDMVLVRRKDVQDMGDDWPEYPQFEELKVIAYKPELAVYLESIESAIYFQQLSHWQKYAKQSDGYFYKTADEIQQETYITEKQQRRCRDQLKKLGWIDYKKKMANGHPTYHYKVLVRSFGVLIPTGEMPVGTGKKASSITKNTHKNKYTPEVDKQINILHRRYVQLFKIDPLDWQQADAEARTSLLRSALARYKLTPARKQKIATRLDDAGYEMCLAAIKNANQVPWNHGENDRGWKMDLYVYLFRNYEMVERWANHEV